MRFFTRLSRLARQISLNAFCISYNWILIDVLSPACTCNFYVVMERRTIPAIDLLLGKLTFCPSWRII